MADNITNWKLLTATSSPQLSDQVRKLIDEGWRTHGNHQAVVYQLTPGIPDFLFSQAMVKYEKK